MCREDQCLLVAVVPPTGAVGGSSILCQLPHLTRSLHSLLGAVLGLPHCPQPAGLCSSTSSSLYSSSLLLPCPLLIPSSLPHSFLLVPLLTPSSLSPSFLFVPLLPPCLPAEEHHCGYEASRVLRPGSSRGAVWLLLTWQGHPGWVPAWP